MKATSTHLGWVNLQRLPAGLLTVAKIIVADENQGRRNLLANTLERAGYEVTRAGTLRQAEGTALATMPEVVLIDGDWASGDAIDSSQRLMADPEFAFKCRIVLLSRTSGQDYMIQAARAGINEVIIKPVDMPKLMGQLEKHCKKKFVPPPADVEISGGGGSFDVSMVMGGGDWALPMLKGLIGPEKINANFITEILQQLRSEGIEVDTNIDPNLMANILRVALNRLVVESEFVENQSSGESSIIPGILPGQKSRLISDAPKSMEEVLENQAQKIAEEVEETMTGILEELPEKVALLEENDKIGLDPELVEYIRLTSDMVNELMWDLGKPGNVTDLTLMTRIEDAAMFLGDVLTSLPEKLEDEEE